MQCMLVYRGNITNVKTASMFRQIAYLVPTSSRLSLIFYMLHSFTYIQNVRIIGQSVQSNFNTI